MRQVVKIMFAVSDWCARGVAIVSVAGALAYPFAGPAYAAMSHTELSAAGIVATVLIALTSAAGASLLLRRRPFGFVLAVLPCIAWALNGSWEASFWYGGFASVVFGSPLVISYAELARKLDQASSAGRG